MPKNKSRARIMHELRVENDRLRRKLRCGRLCDFPDFTSKTETYEIVPVVAEAMVCCDISKKDEIPEIQRRLREQMSKLIMSELDKYAQFYVDNRSYGDVCGIRVFMVRRGGIKK